MTPCKFICYCSSLGVAVDSEAVQVLRRRRFDSPPASAVIGTLSGVTSSSSLSGTTTRTASSPSSVSCCSAVPTLAGKLLVLTTLWLVNVYTLCRGTAKDSLFRGTANIFSVVDVPAVFTTNVNLVYIMSWVFLQRQFVSVRVCSL